MEQANTATACQDLCKCFFGGVKVHGRGPIDSPIVIVGESPGPMELAKRMPFVGPSGKVLEESLAAAYEIIGVPKDQRIEPYFTNAIECFPRQKDADKLASAVGSCRNRLLAEIERFPRKVIIALGNGACWALSGDYNLKITKIRGTLLKTPLAEHGIVTAVHPAFLLRGSGNFKQFKDDLAFALSLAHGTASSAQRISGSSLDVPYEVIDSWDKADKLRQELFAISHGSAIGSDIETSSFSYYAKNQVFTHYPSENPILCLGLSWRLPGAPTAGGKYRTVIIEPPFLGNYLFPEHLKYVWHNGKFDVKFFWHQEMRDARVDEDTMLMSYGLNERRGIHDLDQVASDHLGTPKHKDMLEQHLPKKGTSYANIPKSVLYQYLAYDCYKTVRLHEILRQKVKDDPQTEKLYTRLFIPASEYLAEIEMNGLRVDTEWTHKNQEEMTAESNQYEATLNSYAREIIGTDVNPRSPKQLQELLYNKLALAKPGTSTDADTLEKLPSHPVVVNLLKYRKVHKALSTYVIPDLENMAPDGKVHTTYLIHGTATGRLASREPNKQNVPRNPKIRGQIVADDGYVFIEPDLNQAELRSLACMSGDEELCRIYNTEGMSLHDEVRDFIFGTPKDWDEWKLNNYLAQFYISEETPEKRVARLREEQKMIAKNVNFGIVYGITAFGLSEQIERPASEAATYIAAWFRRFPKAKEFIDRCMQAAARGETIITPYGRKKRPGLVTMEKLRDLQNEAANFPHQATASDFVLDTGIRIRRELQTKFKTTVHNTVHDSILLMTPKDIPLIKEVVEYTTKELQRTPKLVGMTRVPFKADAKIGERWGHLDGTAKWLAKQEAA